MSIEEMEEAETSAKELGDRAGEEPLEMRLGLRAAIGEDPVRGLQTAVAAVGALLFSKWQEELERRGLDAGSFEAIVADVSHELWLWLMGDRPYAQLTAALAGRALRRSSPPSTGA